MSRKISVWIKDPGKAPRHVNISNTLDNLQRTVDGYIKTVTISSDLVIICDEEGRIKGKPYCCSIYDVEDFVGTVIFAGVDNDEFADCPADAKTMKLFFLELWQGVTT